MTATLIIGDVHDVLAGLDDRRFQCIVTSPPYFARRAYVDDEREIGRGDLVEYLDAMAKVSHQLWRVLRDDGLLWLNIGDTAVGSGGAGGDYNAGGTYEHRSKYRQGSTALEDGTKLMPGQWANIPGRLISVLQGQGWRLRQTIVWDKRRPRRADVAHERRPLEQWEPIFMLSKARASEYAFLPEPLNAIGRGNVWQMSPSTGPSGKAPYPVELPRRCIALSCLPGDEVLDPFVGGGASLVAAERHGCPSVGIDLDSDMIDVVRARIPDVEVVS
jgi:site-specific DNA-methyltransferase (adenine-specific)/site-specific DNA-methyltransferase (cytosine-N4-specific)